MNSKTASDFIIVGAGSAGAVLASRLTENPSTRVLLLEAGLDYTSAETIEEIRTKAMAPALEYEKLPDYYWMNLKARRNIHQDYQFYWRGKGVGGSSAINGQVAFRPPPEDFELWSEMGCAGWEWERVLPYFIRLEDDEMFGDDPYHGRGGPIPITREPFDNWSSLDLAFRNAAIGTGYQWSPDTNAPTGSGTAYYPFNNRNGVRVSTNDGYLEGARGRPNLVIRPNVIVDRLCFDGSRAIGVRMIGANGAEDVFADQVILCGGVVGSASVLMRSGIGPSRHLGDLGITVRADLPVGQGVQDHANVSLTFPVEPAPNVGVGRPVCCISYSTGLAGAGRNDAFIGASGPWGENLRMGSALAWLNQTFSRGTLLLESTDPTVDAIVDIDLLNDERDRQRSRHILRSVCELLHHGAFSDVIASTPKAADGTLFTEIEKMSDGEVETWARTVVRDVAHLSGSCRMGAADQPETVVDPDCRVLGFEGLRVIDASVFPIITRANLNIPTIMIAERMADRLRGTKQS